MLTYLQGTQGHRLTIRVASHQKQMESALLSDWGEGGSVNSSHEATGERH